MQIMNKIVRKLLNSFCYSCAGIIACWYREASFRIEVICFAILSVLAWGVAHTLLELAALWGSLLLVLAFELINSAIEKVADSFVRELHHPLIKYAKDAASAAVMLSIFIAILIWIGILAGL